MVYLVAIRKVNGSVMLLSWGCAMARPWPECWPDAAVRQSQPDLPDHDQTMGQMLASHGYSWARPPLALVKTRTKSLSSDSVRLGKESVTRCLGRWSLWT